MADIEFSDGSTIDFPKREGETLSEFAQRHAAEMDAEYEAFKNQCKGTILERLFGE